MRKRMAGAAGTAVLALTLAACGSGGTAEDGQTTLVYAQPTPESMAFYPYIVADELGYFAEAGLQVELAPASEDVPTSTLVLSGNADIGIAGGAEILHASATDRSITAVYDLLRRSPEGIVVPADSPISSVADLAGATIGMASDEERDLIHTSLREAGLTLDDVELAVVGTSGPTLANELQEGNLDAFAGSLLDFAAMDAAGMPTRDITPEVVASNPSSTMIVSPETLQGDRAAIEGFLRAYARATHLGLQDPDRVEQILRERVPGEWQNEAIATSLWETSLEFWRPADNRYGTLRREAWQALQDQLLAAGSLENPADLETLLNGELLDAANSWDRDATG